jgi:hypothetical protein
MTGRSHFDIDAILGDEPAGDPDHRARLVAGLSAVLETGKSPLSADIAQLAAYLDQGLTEEEKLSLYQDLQASAAVRADLESAIRLLETVEKTPQRPSAAVMARARDIAMGMPIPGPRKSLWQRLWEPRARLGLGFAFTALAALAVWIPMAEIGAPNSTPTPQLGASGGADDASRSAFLGRGVSGTDNSIPASPAPGSQSWSAVAVSRTDNIYGVAQDAPTREKAVAAALITCVARHGTACTVALSGQGQCFAVAGHADRAPVAAAADNIGEAQRRALAACSEGRKEMSSCAVSTSFCSGK